MLIKLVKVMYNVKNVRIKIIWEIAKRLGKSMKKTAKFLALNQRKSIRA